MKNLLDPRIDRPLAFAKKIFLVIVLLLIRFFSNAQLRASFISTPDSGCAPLVVNFSDLSSGNPNYWKWDLGDGTVSFLQNPSATYFNPGAYNIKLVIKNSQGTDSIIKNQLINVYAAPQVNFSATPQSGCIPLPVKFADSSLPASGTIAGMLWDFGDGDFSTDNNPQHIYTIAGSYNVSLRVTNGFGCVTSVTKPRYMQISSAPKADFTNTQPATCNQPAVIKFFDASTGAGILSYQWKFGDGSTSALANPSHTYAVGIYTVSLIVFNSNGCSDTIIKPDLIKLGNVKADFSSASIICQETSVNFLNTSTPVPSVSKWDFGDGTFSSSFNPVHVFTKAGSFKVKMVAGFGACKDSVTKPVQVLSKPQVDFAGSTTVSCKAPLTVNFTNITSAGNTFSWDFGDGTTSNLSNPSHIYLKEGFYSVKLIFTNAAGCVNSIVKNDFIKIKSPAVSINGLPQKGCGPLRNKFIANINSVDPIVSYLWNFGDSTSSALASPDHTYTTPGSYSVSLTYSTASGCIATVKVINGILVGSKPAANFSASPSDACAFTKVNFTDLSTGNPNEWLWLFGDGSTSTLQNPEHLYSDTGYFPLRLIAINNGCADTLLLPRYIHIKPPIAKFSETTVCSQPGHVVFVDKSIGADSWQWDFGDGTSSTLQNPVHDYVVSGSHTVQLTVRNSSTGCDFTENATVDVLKESANFTSNITNVCKKAPVIFNAINSIPGNISSYIWRFGDGTTESGTSNTITHDYKNSGSYDVTLILKIKNGCTDSIVKPLAMQVDGPTADFSTKNPGACQNSAVIFNDSSYTDGSHPITQWQWNWGDGTIQNLTAPFQHQYDAAGKYSVSIKVTDSNGCSDSIIYLNTLVISKPAAIFTADTLACTSTEVAVKNFSTGPGLTYLWDFGDATTSTQLNPVHNYNKEGIYSVSLSVTDIYGCSDFTSKMNYVRIANPKADFAVSDTFGTCPPLIVNFTNRATNYSGWTWDFGDGTSSSSFNPSHFYAAPGTYTAVLTVKGPGGCIDKKSVKIKVMGPLGSFKYTNILGCTPLQTNFKATTGKNISIIWDFIDGTTVTTQDSIISHAYKTSGTYLPKMILVDSNGCKVPIVGSDSIKVIKVFASFQNSAAIVCDSGQVKFSNTSTGNDIITNYLWNFGDKNTSVLSNPIHNYSRVGFYSTQLVIISKNGCMDSVTVPKTVKVVNSPKIAIGGNTGACTPAELTFTGLISVQDSSSLKWNWDFDNGNASTLQNPPVQTFVNAGSHGVRAIAVNSSGCSDTAIKTVQAYPLPNLDLMPDTTLCVGAYLNLKANDAQTYSWSPVAYLSCHNCATPVARPDSAIKYFVTGRSDKGCLATDSVFIDLKFPNTVKIKNADTLCIGSSVQLSASGAEKYSWFPSTGLNDPNIASPVASPSNTTIYKVTGSDTKGCFSSTANVAVTVYPIPEVSAGESQTINVGKSLEINPKISPDVTDVLWTPSAGIIARNYPGIMVMPTQSTEYTILVKNKGGCFARDEISVYVTCDNSNIFVPNTFSPNGDGTNDVFYPRGSGLFRIKNFIIFNRWGQVVFNKGNFNPNDASAGWDGTFKGQKLPPDVFVYELEVLCANNQSLVFKGNVALIK